MSTSSVATRSKPAGMIAYLNGDKIPAVEAQVSVADLGLQGLGVTEMLRTFRGKPFLIEPHLQRLRSGLSYMGIEIPETDHQLVGAIQQLAEHNYQAGESQELGVVVFVTPGLNPTYLGTPSERATVCIHSFPLPMDRWKSAFQEGVKLTISQRPQVALESFSPSVKIRSRALWHVADREADQQRPGSRALMCMAEGTITETSTSNFFLVQGEELWTAPKQYVLPGISRGWVLKIASALGIVVKEREFSEADLENAQGAFLTSTPYCMMPVQSVNERRFDCERSLEIFHHLATRWETEVDCQWRKQLQ